MDRIKISCDHGTIIELSVINGELNLSIIAEGDLLEGRTAPISSQRKVDELLVYLNEFRKTLV